MGSKIVQRAGLDRRILRAFYTQYVAVLLIVLVFTVASFQRAFSAHSSVQPTSVVKHNPSVGAITLPWPVREDEEVQGAHADLAALATLLREHDLRAVFTIPKGAELGGSFKDLLREVSAVEHSLEALHVPPSSFRFVLGSEHDGEARVRVDFEEVARDKHIL